VKRGLELAQKSSDPRQDLISCMLSTRDENNREVITEMGIEDIGMLVMTAGHDTSSILVTFLIRLLANEPSIYAAILNGIHDLFFYSATDNLYRKSEQHKQHQYAKMF